MFAPTWGGGVKRPHDAVEQVSHSVGGVQLRKPADREIAKRKRTGYAGLAGAQQALRISQLKAAAPVMAVPMQVDSASSLPGVRAATYCVKQRKKTANVGAHVVTIMVNGKARYQLKATCAECGAKKCSFLTAAKTGGRLRA